MCRYLKKFCINDYFFRSHDFRHTVATYMDEHGTSIETIRDYLGHKESDMTKRYLDYEPQMLDDLNEKYFASDVDPLVSHIKESEKDGGR